MFQLLKILRSGRNLEEVIRFQGMLRLCELPDEWTREEYLRYWCGERDEQGHVIKPAIMTKQEKERYTVVEARNQLMAAGRTSILSYIGGASGNTTAFGKYLAIGTGVLQATSPSDTALVNEVYRVAQTTNTVQGSQMDVNFQIPSASAQVTMTESGLFGGTASTTAGSGTLVTHVLFSYTKGAAAIAADYIITLI